MASISTIEGIAATNAKKLAKAGITTVEGLLQSCADRKSRKTVSETTGIDEKKLLAWVNRADLCRIKGVAGQYSDLLEKAGVDTVKELARRKPESLHAKMTEVNSNRKTALVRQVPALSKVESWVEQAQTLKGSITY